MQLWLFIFNDEMQMLDEIQALGNFCKLTKIVIKDGVIVII